MQYKINNKTQDVRGVIISNPILFQRTAVALALATLTTAASANQCLLWRNQNTGLNYLYDISGLTIDKTSALNTIADTQWQLATTADLNGDGEDDLVWRHQSTGQNYVYLMQQGGIKQQIPLDIIADQNWQIVAQGDLNQDGQYVDAITGDAQTQINPECIRQRQYACLCTGLTRQPSPR